MCRIIILYEDTGGTRGLDACFGLIDYARKPKSSARSGPTHLRRFASRRKARRTPRPRHPPTLAVRRYVRSSTQKLCHLTLGGLTSPVSRSSADDRRAHRSNFAKLLSPSARERVALMTILRDYSAPTTQAERNVNYVLPRWRPRQRSSVAEGGFRSLVFPVPTYDFLQSENEFLADWYSRYCSAKVVGLPVGK
jgi:hypothetical protein